MVVLPEITPLELQPISIFEENKSASSRQKTSALRFR